MELPEHDHIELLSETTKKEIQRAAIAEFNLRRFELQTSNGIDLIRVYSAPANYFSSKEYINAYKSAIEETFKGMNTLQLFVQFDSDIIINNNVPSQMNKKVIFLVGRKR